jgi:immunoglobulin-like protein involved in spore germination
MKDDVFERLRAADPATDDRILQEARALGDVAGPIASSEPTIVHRFPKTVRRQATLVAVAAVVVVAIVLPLTLLRSLGDGNPTPGENTGNWVTVGSLAEVNERGVTYVSTPGAPTAGVFVIARAEGDPYALSATPTGDTREATRERVLFCPAEGGTFIDTSGAIYAPSGDVIEGPADHGLSPVDLRLLEGSVQIDPSEPGPGSTTVRAEGIRVGCETAGGAPLEGAPGFGLPLGASLPPIAVALPQSGMSVFGSAHVAGSANVFEATVSIRVLDERGTMIAESFTTATCGTGCRGDYATDVPFAIDHRQPGTVQVFESSAKDGSMINTVEIPVTLLPGVPSSSGVEGVWFDGNGVPLPDGSPGAEGTVLVVFKGAEHCQWESASFMHLGWPVGTLANGLEDWRQYVRDPKGLFDDGALHVGYLGDTSLPADAVDTGYHRGSWHLFVSPSEAGDAVYVFNGNSGAVERWGRSNDVILCK